MNAANTTSHNDMEHPKEGGSILTGLNPAQFNPNNPLLLFIIQVTVILVLCYIVNSLLSRLRQPRVTAEIISGILLGPSVLGKIPHFHETIFPEKSIPFLRLVANLGLVLFFFLIGLELDPNLVLKRARRVLGIAACSFGIPFAPGAALSILLYRRLEVPDGTAVGFAPFLIFCCLNMSVTSFGVLARVLADLKLLATTVGFMTACAGALVDIFAWVLLALVIGIVNSSNPITPLYVVLLVIAWTLFLVFVVRPLLVLLIRVTHSEEDPSHIMIAITIIAILASAFVTDILGIHAILGGFLVGMVIPSDTGFAEGLARRLEDLVGVIFLPIFFTTSGLKTQIGLLNTGEAWGLVILVTSVTFGSKLFGCSLASHFAGMTWRESFAIALLMNCKGTIELIVLNIGYDAGVIHDRMFVILVAMCIFSTLMVTPFVRLVFPVSYQREIEAKRARELKFMETSDSTDDETSCSGDDEEKMSSPYPGRLQPRKEVNAAEGYIDNVERDGDLISHHLPHIDIADISSSSAPAKESLRESRRQGILFCLDKTANAPSVMALLQLFSGTSTARITPHSPPQSSRSAQQHLEPDNSAHFRHPTSNSLDADTGNTSNNVNTSRQGFPLFALRLLHISERPTSVMLTSSLDRLYKDTVMVMVMAFSKLNSIIVKPLVTLSMDVTSPDAADDILDQAVEHDASHVIFPWNSSRLADLNGSDRPSTGPPPSLPLSRYPTNMSNLETRSQQSLRYRNRTDTSVASFPDHDLHHEPRHTPQFFHFPRLFDHDVGGPADQTDTGKHHRASITSNTKVLSYLVDACPQHHIATGVLVDRGLGLAGSIQHIVVPVFGGHDDEEALLMASFLASNPAAACFVTILRLQDLSPNVPLRRHVSVAEWTQQNQHRPHESQLPVIRAATDTQPRSHDESTAGCGDNRPPLESHVPNDDEGLLRTFFPTKPRFKGSSHRMDHTQQAVDGIIVLHFQTMADVAHWAKTCLTLQDLMVVGADASSQLRQAWYSGRTDGGAALTSSSTPSLPLNSAPPSTQAPPQIVTCPSSPASKSQASLSSMDNNNQSSSPSQPATGLTAAVPPTLRRMLSEKRLATKDGKPNFISSAPPAPTNTAPSSTVPADSVRQMILGPAVEYFIQSQIQVSYLVVRSRYGLTSRPSTAAFQNNAASGAGVGANTGASSAVTGRSPSSVAQHQPA